MAPIIASIVSGLISNGLPKIADAVIEKGVDYVEGKLGVTLKPEDEMKPEDIKSLRERAMQHAEFMVEQENNTYGRAALLETIRQAGGQVREVEPNFDGDQSPNGVTFLGIDVSLSQADMGQVLTVWCQKARRAILAGQVAPDAPVPSDAEV